MKLKDWAKKEGISYQTAYRWFKAGTLPGKAYQSESGTIIVQDEENYTSENNMNRLSSNSDAMSHFLKKTVEFSKANYSIEDFAAYVIANFQLKISPSAPDMSLKYSKIKPSQNEVNKHFQQFIKPKQFNKTALINSLDENTQSLKQELVNDPELKDLATVNYEASGEPSNSIANFVEGATSSALNRPTPTSTVLASSTNTLGGASAYYTLLTGNLDGGAAPLNFNSQVWTGEVKADPATILMMSSQNAGAPAFQPTPKEIESFKGLVETQDVSDADELPVVKKAKRGRPKKL